MKALTDVLIDSSQLVRETGLWILQQSSQFTGSDIIYKGTGQSPHLAHEIAPNMLKVN